MVKLPSLSSSAGKRLSGGPLAMAMHLSKQAMQGAWEEHRERSTRADGHCEDGAVWAKRPLDDELCCYAASDVECCQAMYDSFISKPACSASLIERVQSVSDARLAEYRDLEVEYPQSNSGADPAAALAPVI